MYAIEFETTAENGVIKIPVEYKTVTGAKILKSGCCILFTEDMQDGQLIEDSLKITNPFKN